MAFIRTSRGARGQRPSGPSPVINRASVQAQGLLLHYGGIPGTRDTVGGVQFAPLSTNPRTKGSNQGVGVYGATADSGWYSTTLPSRLQLGRGFTLVTSFYYGGSPASDVTLWGIGYDVPTWPDPYVTGIALNRSSGGNIWYYVQGTLYEKAGGLSVGFHTAALKVNALGNIYFWVDGVLDTAGTQAVGKTVSYSGTSALLTGEPSANARYTDSILLDGRMYTDVAWTDAVAWHHYEPSTRWDLYAVPSTRVYVDQGAAAAAFLARRPLSVNQAVNRSATF